MDSLLISPWQWKIHFKVLLWRVEGIYQLVCFSFSIIITAKDTKFYLRGWSWVSWTFTPVDFLVPLLANQKHIIEGILKVEFFRLWLLNKSVCTEDYSTTIILICLNISASQWVTFEFCLFIFEVFIEVRNICVKIQKS